MKKITPTAKTGVTRIGGKIGIAMCCAAILGMSAMAGTSVYNGASNSATVAEVDNDFHEQRILARTIGGEESPGEWDWEVSTDSYLP